jgi:hypothetical protein
VADVSRTIDSYAAFTISAHGEEDRLKRRRALPATKNEGGFLRRATLIWAHDRGPWPVRGLSAARRPRILGTMVTLDKARSA